MSSRHMKKGPGRRPRSAKPQQFLELLARGWTAAAARSEVGVSRAPSHNWRCGHKVRLKDCTVRFVPLLDPRTTKEISLRFLSDAERVEIADRRRAGKTMQTIADAIGRSISTISREFGRNSGPVGNPVHRIDPDIPGPDDPQPVLERGQRVPPADPLSDHRGRHLRRLGQQRPDLPLI